MVRRSLTAILTTCLLLVASGCGGGASPADEVPALATALDRVDEAVVARDHAAARDAVARLIEVATRAEEAGDLDADQAERIVTAGEALVAALPGAGSPPAAPETATPTTTAPDEDEEDAEEDDEGSAPTAPEDSDESGPKGQKHKKSKGKKKH